MKKRLTGAALALLAGTLMLLPDSPANSAAPPMDAYARDGVAFDAASHPGKAVFEQACASCHEGGVPKAPHREFLQMMAPESILHALTSGVMQAQAAHLDDKERRAVVEFLTHRDLSNYTPPPGPRMCTGDAAVFDMTRPPAGAGWGYDNRRFVPAAAAGLKPADVSRLKLKWAYGFPSAIRARSLPVVAMGAVFVGSNNGTVHAFDLESGCARWTSNVGAEVRTAVVVESWPAGQKPATPPRLFFGDLMGRVYAMNALTGEVLWKARPSDHANATITGTPVLHDGLLYVPVSSLEVVTAADEKYECCTFRGFVAALDPATGEEKWRHYTVDREAEPQGKTRVGTTIMGPSGAPVWNSPTIDAKRGVLYHGSGENYSSPADGNSDAVFAVDLKTGNRLWRFQTTAGDAWNGTCTIYDSEGRQHPNCPAENGPDYDLSASVLLIDIGKGKQRVIAAPKSGVVHALDPDKGGALVWKTPVGRGSIQGGTHFGMAAEGTRVYVPIVDMKMKADGKDHDTRGNPGLHAVDARNGRILWSAIIDESRCNGRKYCHGGISAAVTAMPGVVFAGGLDGWLRAFDGKTGKLLWETDTAQQFRTENGEIARGGSIGGPGPIVASGHVLVNSGYGFSGHMPGNALLVYSVDGQ